MMDRKLSLIVIAVAVALIVAGGYLIISNPSNVDVSGDSLKIPLKTQDFKIFEINAPEGSNLTVKNEASGMKYYQNVGNYSDKLSGIIINKGLTEFLIGDNSELISNSSSEHIYSFDLKNKTSYKCVSSHDGVDVIVMGDDLNLLKEVSNTVKIKDADAL
jgi:hypothetical protein